LEIARSTLAIRSESKKGVTSESDLSSSSPSPEPAGTRAGVWTIGVAGARRSCGLVTSRASGGTPRTAVSTDAVITDGMST